MSTTANTYFFTGFPGFIASSLIKNMINDGYAIEKIHLLILPSQRALAEKTIQEIVQTVEKAEVSQFAILEGDITQDNLGLNTEQLATLKDTVNYVYHLAAIYDLAVPKDIAYKVNVTGTDNVNTWVKTLTNLSRYVYFSTCYVAGDRDGKILETELEMGQGFKNHYESTKYEAEVLVKQLTDIPTTVIRPGIVVGHSETGHTLKFDGPYFFFNLFNAFKLMPWLIPYFGKGAAPANFVPVDFIFDATIYLAHSEKGINKTYQLANPKVNSIREVFAMLYKEQFGSLPKFTVPISLAYAMLGIKFLRKWVNVEREVLDYFTLMADYDSTNTQTDLANSGVKCPEFKDLAPVMHRYYQANKDAKEKFIKIH